MKGDGLIYSTHSSLFEHNSKLDPYNGYSSVTDLVSSSLTHGIDWIFSNVESMFVLDYKLVYFWMSNSLYDDSNDSFFTLLWYTTMVFGSLQLFWSYILDSYLVSEVLCNHFNEEWYKGVLSSRDVSLFSIYHPEIVVINQQYSQSSISNYMTSFNSAIRELVETERFVTPVASLIDVLVVLFFVTMFLSVYFSYFSTSTKEEVTIDYDYLSVSGTVEAEKEITGLDDVLMGMIIVLYLFGWYFYVHCWALFSNLPELIVLFYLLPALCILILFMPLNLVFDFGGLFLAYLRGVGATPLVLYELMFDYIAFLIFCVRIVVQGVRIVLMVFTYASMHELITHMYNSPNCFILYESFWDELAAVSFNIKSVSWYLLVTLPARIIYWLYEVLHTFFVLTGQCVAFFAIVFWLYLFLYTFFVIEKQEDYFYHKRVEFRKYYSKLHKSKTL